MKSLMQITSTQITELLSILQGSDIYQSIKSELIEDNIQLRLGRLGGSSLAYLLANLVDDMPDSTFLIVTETQDEIENLSHDLSTFRLENEIVLFPPWQTFLHGGASPAREILADRMLTLERLTHGQRSIVITSIRALMHKILPLDVFRGATLHFVKGEEIDLSKVSLALTNSGYQRVEMVEMKGDFSIRGGIIDIYPLSYEMPVRIELFGDEIDSMRHFDPISQRSTTPIERDIWVVPMSEIIITPDMITYWEGKVEKIIDTAQSPKLTNEINQLTRSLKEHGRFDGIEGYLPLLYPNLVGLWNYLPENTIIVMDDPQWLSAEAEKLMEQSQQFFEMERDRDRLAVSSSEMFASFDDITEFCKTKKALYLTHEQHKSERIYDFGVKTFEGLRGNFQMFLREIEKWVEQNYSVNIMSDNDRQAERMRDILLERNIAHIPVYIGSINAGFVSDNLKLALISDDEMFGRYKKPVRKRKFKEGIPISSFTDLKLGDFVVHVSYGIGVYDGIKQLKIEGRPQDFMKINYQDGDALYVPTYQLDLVHKYIGGDEVKAKVDKLGGTSWDRVKRKVKESAREIAKELLELYAAREAGVGHAFPPDTTWQLEFEATFPYEETEDQLTAIEDVKRDMEKPKPMDRLICGDVGYGKTEVALRAAFKAVIDGKQVAVLVPTTVLAQQHFNTFSQRFADYPVKIDMLSRFRSSKEQKLTLENLASGKVDIIIGTHRILSKDMKFKNLGLLVIDEEQRFGVVQKEKLKQMRKIVDVIALSATPIPRTLHMSVMGARDISIINTPPENRLPIETYVMQYDQDIVREAILHEMDRGGQIFFVHNRVESIDSIAQVVQSTVPEARIAVAHGQMPERQLESVMMDFINRKYDVLVCTTIIESGLDIPNVNTIIINRADALGLAQLYQLRGRVGRDKYKAYGYLFYPADRALSEDSQKRLQVIEEFTDLGSGFRIALRDLEIRGMGNILGAEQHGHMMTVGYDMYCRLLEEAVKELKGEEIEDDFESKINLAVEAYISDKYISDSSQKVSIYRRIAQISSDEESADMMKELEDRYGRLPAQVRRLFAISETKRLAQNLRIKEVASVGNEVCLLFDVARTQVGTETIVKMVKSDNNLRLLPPSQLMINVDGLGQDQQLMTIKNVLHQLA
jgi:transcription-repair coupling factor (superfamily II helicase)